MLDPKAPEELIIGDLVDITGKEQSLFPSQMVFDNRTCAGHSGKSPKVIRVLCKIDDRIAWFILDGGLTKIATYNLEMLEEMEMALHIAYPNSANA